MSSREVVERLLAQADIQINGKRPWDIQIHRADVFDRTLAYGNLGFGEAYMQEHWDCEALDEFFMRILRARLDTHIDPKRLAWYALKNRLFNFQTKRRAWQVGQRHYDIGN